MSPHILLRQSRPPPIIWAPAGGLRNWTARSYCTPCTVLSCHQLSRKANDMSFFGTIACVHYQKKIVDIYASSEVILILPFVTIFTSQNSYNIILTITYVAYNQLQKNIFLRVRWLVRTSLSVTYSYSRVMYSHRIMEPSQQVLFCKQWLNTWICLLSSWSAPQWYSGIFLFSQFLGFSSALRP